MSIFWLGQNESNHHLSQKKSKWSLGEEYVEESILEANTAFAASV